MPERLVLCGGATLQREGRGAEPLRLALQGPNQNITVRLQDITTRLVADVPDLLVDLLEVAAYVYSADWGTSRGGPVQQNFGSAWRRNFHFVIPVRNPDTWNDPEVLNALVETLSFLSEDEYRFEFVSRSGNTGMEPYLEFDSSEQPGSFKPDDVILFSGGLDSLAGVVESVVAQGRKAVLVSHHSATKIVARQRELVTELRKKAPGKIFHVPVRVDKTSKLEQEFTLRSRSFLFASMAVAIGRMFGKAQVRFFENGVVSMNLPILPQVVGARATRTTHPQALAGFEKVFSALFGEDIAVENPYAFKSKAEVVQLIEDYGCGDLIRATVSCTHVRGMTKYKTHCGVCSQCIDRRFGVLAAGIGHRDPEEMYEVRLLEDERPEGPARTMAEGYVKAAVEIERMTDRAFVGKYAGELSRAIRYLPGAADQNAQQLFQLHKRHAHGVFSVLASGVSGASAEIVGGLLPAHSLLMIAVSGHGELSLVPAKAPQPTMAPAQDDGADHSRSAALQIALNDDMREVLLAGLASLKGKKTFGLFQILSESYRNDQLNGRAPENYTYLNSGELAQRLQTEEPSLRKLISRIRGRVFKDFQTRYGMPLPNNALIENASWQGYRLNPDVKLLHALQISE